MFDLESFSWTGRQCHHSLEMRLVSESIPTRVVPQSSYHNLRWNSRRSFRRRSSKKNREMRRAETASQELVAFFRLLLDTRGEDSLKMRTLLFPRNHRHFDVAKARFLQPLMQLHFAKPQPLIGVELTRFLKAMIK